MKRVESVREVRRELGEKYPRGKPEGVFPQQRHVTTHEGKKMKGLILGSGLTTQQIFDEKARGKEYEGDVNSNPDYYQHQP